MNASALGPGPAADGTRLAIDRLEREVDLIIRAARRPAPDEPYGCDAAEVITERFGFWSALAEDQARPCQLNVTGEAAPVPLPRSDLATATDSLIGNIFKHTPEGTGFAVTLHRGEGAVLILVADAGPGIADPDTALRRGSSGAGSTGLGLDIARRVAESTGGGLKIGVSAFGGAQLQLRLRTWSLPPGGRRGRKAGPRWPRNGGLFQEMRPPASRPPKGRGRMAGGAWPGLAGLGRAQARDRSGRPTGSRIRLPATPAETPAAEVYQAASAVMTPM
jgi:hypothetical protein